MKFLNSASAGVSALAAILSMTSVASAQTQLASNDEIVVFGTGQARQVQTLTAADLSIEAPGTSAIKLVERLPGVTYTAADPFGAYEWAVNINIRGFQKDQLGYTLDGVPLGDMSYGNYNGLHISRAVISENIGRVELSQGAGAVSTASTSNLGGTLQFFSLAPKDEFGGVAQVTAGSEDTLRGFFRLESGVISGLGGKGYVSYANSKMDKWKGDGEQKHEQANVRFDQPIGPGVLSAYYDWSKRRENDYQDLSLEMIRRLGSDWDNFAPNWELANRVADIANNRGDTGAARTNPAAGTVYPAPIASVDDAYYDASGLRDDKLARLNYTADFGETVSVSGTIYNHTDEGQGTWYTPYANPYTTNQTTISAISPVSVRTTEYDMDRVGGLGSVTLNLGAHKIVGGFWIENNKFNQARRFYANDRAAPRDSLKFMRSPFATQWEFDYEFDTTMLYVSDVWNVTDRLTVNAGVKSVKVDMAVDTIANGFTGFAAGSDADVNGTITSEDNFLPQIGASYAIAEGSEVFAGYTENMRAHTLAPNNNRSQISFDAIKNLTDPESSKTAEAGWRYRNGPFQGVVAAYYVKFEDRLLGISQGAGIIGNPSIISNVGGVTTKGVELAGTYNLTDDLSVFGAYSYNDSTYDDDVKNALGAVIQATADKTVVNTPKHLFKADVNYDNGAIFASLSANYTGERFFSYLNNASVDGYVTADFSVGYRFSGNPMLEGLEVQANITNLLNEGFVSTVGTNGFNTAADNQTLMVGAPRQAFVTVRKKF
jgi:iron complex outermembrane receptor protein